MASPPQLLVSKAMPKHRPTQNSISLSVANVFRLDLTTIAIHPFEADINEEHIAEIRSHYLDEHFEDWQVLVGFSKTMSAILRHAIGPATKATKSFVLTRRN